MAVTVTGSTAPVAATTITLPAHNVGDCIIIYGWRNNTAAGPTVPSAGGTVPFWLDVGAAAASGSLSSGKYVLCYAVATATNHTSGTWTNASGLAAVVLSGADPVQPVIGRQCWDGSSGTTYGIYAPYSMTETTTTGSWVGTGQWPQRDISGNSVLLNFLSGGSISTFGSAPSGWTRVGANTSAKICVNQKNSSSGIPVQTAFNQTGNTNSYYNSDTIEVVGPQTLRTLGQLTASGTSVTIPAHAAGDMIVIFSVSGSTTIPTAPSAGGTVPTWNTLYANGTQRGLRIAYAVATAGTTTSGTWTNSLWTTAYVVRRPSDWTGIPTLALTVVGSSQSSSSSHTGPAITTVDRSGLGLTLNYAYTSASSIANTGNTTGYMNLVGAPGLTPKFDPTDGTGVAWNAGSSGVWVSAQLEIQGLVRQSFFNG